MLTVLRNTLYMYVFSSRNQLASVDQLPHGRYGGIYERGSREYTLDDFYSIQLDKLDKCTCLKESAVVVPDVGEETSSSDDDDDDDDDDESGGEDDSDDEGEEGTLVGDVIEEGGIKKAIAVPVLEVADEEGADEGHEEGFEEIQDEKVLTFLPVSSAFWSFLSPCRIFCESKLLPLWASQKTPPAQPRMSSAHRCLEKRWRYSTLDLVSVPLLKPVYFTQRRYVWAI